MQVLNIYASHGFEANLSQCANQLLLGCSLLDIIALGIVKSNHSTINWYILILLKYLVPTPSQAVVKLIQYKSRMRHTVINNKCKGKTFILQMDLRPIFPSAPTSFCLVRNYCNCSCSKSSLNHYLTGISISQKFLVSATPPYIGPQKRPIAITLVHICKTKSVQIF